MRFSPWLQRFHRLELNVGWRVRELFRLGKKRHARQFGWRDRRLASAAEVFEDRTLLSALTVNSDFDDTFADEELTLREAILLVNNAGDSNAAFGRMLTPQEMAQIDNTEPFGTNDTITFTDPGVIFLFGPELPITADVDIRGLGANVTIIDAFFAGSRIFNVNDFDDDNQVTVAISGLTLTGGSTAFDGGAIQNLENLTISNSTLSNNTADGFSGAIDNFGRLTVTGSLLTGNSAGLSGGAIDNFGTVSISNSTVSGNFAGFDGGGISNRNGGILSVTNVNFSENFSDGQGGGIYNDSDLTVTDSDFSLNFASFLGGGIDNFDEFATATITNSTFSQNFAGFFGGGIDNFFATMSVSGSMLTNNFAGDSGGGIGNVVGDLTLASSMLLNNSADFAGGGIENISGTVSISDNTEISRNTALSYGGGIDNFDGEVMIADSMLSSNFAGFDGGGIENNGFLSVTGSRILQNSASRFGGGIDNYIGSVTVANSSISQNSASFGGGIESFAGTLMVTKGMINQNTASSFGGGIENFSGDATILDSVISGNFSGQDGGGIENVFSNLTVNNTLFSQNGSFGIGGGIDNFSSAAAITNSRFENNFAFYGGGGIYNNMDLAVTSSAFTQNSGSVGGGIFNEGTLAVRNSTLSQNTADGLGSGFLDQIIQGGGGILNTGSLSVLYSSLTQNVASGDGGGILNFDQLEVGFSTLSQNFASANGGGISNFNRTLLANSTLSQNSAGVDGGGISNSAVLLVDNTTLSQNSANRNGGGILNNLALELLNLTIFGNRADADGNGIGTGGGLWTSAVSDAKTLLTNSIVAGNIQGANSAPNDIANKNVDLKSKNNLIGDPNSAGGLTPVFTEPDGKQLINLLGDGNGNLLDVNTVLRTTLEDNGGPTLTHALVLGSPAINAGFDENLTDLDGRPGIVLPPNPVKQTPKGAGQNKRPDPTLPPTPMGMDLPPGMDPPTMTTPMPMDLPNGGTASGDSLFDQRGPNFFRITGGRIDIGAFEVQFHIDLAIASGGGREGEVILVDSQILPQQFSTLKPYSIPATTTEPLKPFLGGVRVALGDVNGDGFNEIITATGTGGGPHVKVYDGRTFEVLKSFFAYDARFAGGVFVAAADLNNDGFADIITGAGDGGGPHVKAFSGVDGSELFSFFAFDPNFLGGVRVAGGDINGNGTGDIIAAAGPGGGPHVRVFEGSAPNLAAMGQNIAGPLGSFWAYEPSYTGGVYVAADNTGFPQGTLIVTGSGPKIGGATVGFFGGDGTGYYQTPLASGVTVATFDFNRDGINDFVTSTGPLGNGQVQVLIGPGHKPQFTTTNVQFGPPLLNSFPFTETYRGGVFVAAAIAEPLEEDFSALDSAFAGFPFGDLE